MTNLETLLTHWCIIQPSNCSNMPLNLFSWLLYMWQKEKCMRADLEADGDWGGADLNTGSTGRHNANPTNLNCMKWQLQTFRQPLIKLLSLSNSLTWHHVRRSMQSCSTSFNTSAGHIYKEIREMYSVSNVSVFRCFHVCLSTCVTAVIQQRCITKLSKAQHNA